MKSRLLNIWSVATLIGLTLLVACPLHAATLTVINIDDGGAGSLRQALADAGTGDTITFDAGLAGSTIVLTNGELLVTNNLTITGLGAAQLTISGNNASRVFHIDGNVTATISALTITAGAVGGDNSGGGILNDTNSTLAVSACVLSNNTAAFGGGGIYNIGTLTITNSTVTANSTANYGGGLYNAATAVVNGGSTMAANSALFGAGIYNSTGTVTVVQSSLADNQSSFVGGALYNDVNGETTISQSSVTSNQALLAGGLYNDGTVVMNASTVAGNTASTQNGGGIYNGVNANLLIAISTLANNTAAQFGGAIVSYGTVRLAESTLANNSALSGGASLALLYGSLTIDNTILANALAGGNSTNDGAIVTSLGHNLSDDNSAATYLTLASDRNDTPAGLDPSGLQNNGGPTPTIALADGSTAILAGGPVYAPFTTAPGGGEPIYPPFTDQRGLSRFNCGKMDIGAFQTQDSSPALITLIGDSVVTNECPAVFVDPGATASSACANTLSIAAGGAHSIALRTDGTVATWGDSSAGLDILPVGLGQASAVAAGDFHNLALQVDGLVFAWGDNSSGQTDVPASVTNAIAIAAGSLHSLALLSDGTVVSWGDNTAGQTNVTPGLNNVVGVAAGQSHSLALIGDGTVVGWGDNTAGQTDVPLGLNTAIAIAAGSLHSLAILNDGTVIGWGDNSVGQTNVPANVTNATAIAGGELHSLALLNDGSVLAWGDNTSGQTNVLASLNNGAALAAGASHSLSITRDGAVVGWGLNSNDQTVAPPELRAADLTGSITQDTVGTTNGVGSFTRTYSVINGQGTTSSVVRTVFTLDTTAPVPDVSPLPSITNACAVTLNAPTATDACAGPITGTTGDETTYNTPGTFVVTWLYSDGSGNSATQAQTVVVNAGGPSSIICSPNIVVTNTLDQCGVLVNYTGPDVTTDCGSATTNQIAGLASGAFFPVGITTNVFQVIDASNTTNSCSFTVTVLDLQAPALTCPANIVTNTAPDQCVSLPLTFTPVASDNCSGVDVVSVPASGSTFAKGTNVVTTTATDAAGNTNVCTFTVIVLDQQAPTITCPATIVTNTAPGQCISDPITFASTIDDNCPGSTVVSIPPSGSTFPKGTNTVTSTVTDAAGNTNFCTFAVIVLDQEAPTITCPATIITNTALDQCISGPITFAPTVGDNCPNVNVVSIPPSGSTFPKGTNTVTSTATDDAGNTNTCTFTVIVLDQQAPTLTCPANIITNALPDDCVSAALAFSPSVSDNCPGVNVITIPPSGTAFPRGVTVVTSTATDAAGNTNTCSFTVTVLDQQLPTLTCPATIVTNTAPGQCISGPITFAPTVVDNCPGSTVVSIPPSGSTFPKGTNIVTSTVTDAAGNSNVCTFAVIVVDQQAPTLTCPANIVANTAPDQCQSAAITFTPTVSDNCPDVTVVSVPPSGTAFPKGVTVVTSTATDAAGNTNTCTFTVTIVDQQAPTISCQADIVTNATSAAGTVIVFADPTISDNCPGVTLSNAPGSLVSGDLFPVGSTVVTRIARDADGNQTQCSFTVTVGASAASPRADFQIVLVELTALRAQTTDEADRKQLDKIIARMGLIEAYWLDQSHLNGKSGKKLFNLTKSTLKSLQKLIVSSKSTLPDEPLQAAINRLIAATRVVATIAVNDATVAGVDASIIAKANAELAAGQADETAGSAANACKHYQKAWTLAAKALAKLNS